MVHTSSESTSKGRRVFRRPRHRTCNPLRGAALSGLIGLVFLYWRLQHTEPFPAASLLLKLFDNSTNSENGLVGCDTYEFSGAFEKLMISTRNWPVDQDFNVPDHCIYEHEDEEDLKQCQCRNPTIATPRTADFWRQAFQRNSDFVKKATSLSSEMIGSLDVVLLGDYITEHWIGEAAGRKTDAYAENFEAFQSVLTRKGGGSVDAVALGIASDRIPNLLFRIQAGRFSEFLKPRVWWILIGSNDMAMGWCNEDTVLAGNIAVVEEIRTRQPNAIIVINSILPRLPMDLRPHIDGLNTRLHSYACETDNVYFYNATWIFQDHRGKVIHLDDGVHPDGPSSWIWAREIAKIVQELSEL